MPNYYSCFPYTLGGGAQGSNYASSYIYVIAKLIHCDSKIIKIYKDVIALT